MPLQISGGNQRPHYPQISTLTICIGAKMANNRFESFIKALCALASERGDLNDRVDAAIFEITDYLAHSDEERDHECVRAALRPGRRCDSQTMWCSGPLCKNSLSRPCTSRSLHWLRPALSLYLLLIPLMHWKRIQKVPHSIPVFGKRVLVAILSEVTLHLVRGHCT